MRLLLFPFSRSAAENLLMQKISCSIDGSDPYGISLRSWDSLFAPPRGVAPLAEVPEVPATPSVAVPPPTQLDSQGTTEPEAKRRKLFDSATDARAASSPAVPTADEFDKMMVDAEVPPPPETEVVAQPLSEPPVDPKVSIAVVDSPMGLDMYATPMTHFSPTNPSHMVELAIKDSEINLEEGALVDYPNSAGTPHSHSHM